ncbi:cytochrome aa3 quinol oxidase subunit IV [Caldifermentibacillus hisashii]|uniref:cytochrome aa3 quinol oxidase subunit IV n=1 Tax=Caldifermentibacillus hisashii TaxID=996558 RepID=UPI003D23443E
MQQEAKFPIRHVVGFVLSIAMTFLAAYLVLETNLSKGLVISIIGILAVIQAGLQLFMFMHMTEGDDGWAKVTHTIYAIFMVIVIVAGIFFVTTGGHSIQ